VGRLATGGSQRYGGRSIVLLCFIVLSVFAGHYRSPGLGEPDFGASIQRVFLVVDKLHADQRAKHGVIGNGGIVALCGAVFLVWVAADAVERVDWIHEPDGGPEQDLWNERRTKLRKETWNRDCGHDRRCRVSCAVLRNLERGALDGRNVLSKRICGWIAMEATALAGHVVYDFVRGRPNELFFATKKNAVALGHTRIRVGGAELRGREHVAGCIRES